MLCEPFFYFTYLLACRDVRFYPPAGEAGIFDVLDGVGTVHTYWLGSNFQSF